MKAFEYTRYGPPEVLHLREVPKPVPKPDEVLIRVHASSVTAADYRMRSFNVPAVFWLPARLSFGLVRPRRRILGAELAGEVEAVGKDVKLYKEGDCVFGLDGSGFGGYAEYACRSEKGALAVKPANLDFEEAAALPFGAMTALFFLRDKGGIQSGQEVLVYGASGGVGTAAVQIARYFGAQVTGVCSTANLEMVRSLGAETVVDYTREDFRKNGRTYDIVFDTVGKTTFSGCKNSLKETGRYLLTAFGLTQVVEMLWTSMGAGRKVMCAVAPERADDMAFIRELAQGGDLKPVIDKRYPFEQIAQAHGYAEGGHKKGSVVLTMDHL